MGGGGAGTKISFVNVNGQRQCNAIKLNRRYCYVCVDIEAEE
jgi:hypothetical protein